MFCENPRVTVLLVTIRAYGHGLNLMCANHLILTERDWNPTYEIQAAMRIYRKGQTKETFIYRLVTSNTYDEKIYSAEIGKELISKTVLDQIRGKRANLNEVNVWKIYDNTDDPKIEYTEPTNDVFREVVQRCGSDYIRGIAEHKDLLGIPPDPIVEDGKKEGEKH